MVTMKKGMLCKLGKYGRCIVLHNTEHHLNLDKPKQHKKKFKVGFHWLNVTWVEGKIWFCWMDFEVYGILLSLMNCSRGKCQDLCTDVPRTDAKLFIFSRKYSGLAVS